MTTTGGTQDKPESKYLNSTSIEHLLEDSRDELGSVDLQGPIRTLHSHWVETMRDLRLLHREGVLMSLSTEIKEAILHWIEKECDKRFADDESGDLLLFVFGSDFDKNGIIWYLGSDGGTRDWQNPALPQFGKVRVRASTQMHDSAPSYAAVGRETVRCVTKPVKDSWFEIDFRPRKIRPSHYSLRHYSTWDTEALRYWVFEGKNENNNDSWDVLRKHDNDDALNTKGATHTWPLDNVNEFYSVFRIRQTDFNSNRHYYLAMSGFEIYGAMSEEEKGNEQPHGTLTFIPSYDFDTNGIVYWLGTSRGTEQWQNPGIRGFVKVYYSSLAKDSAPNTAVLGRQTVRCVTEPKKLSWFCIDFGNVKIVPTHYSLRHYSSYDTECLRNWRLEASNDSTNGINGSWTILETHRNDNSLNAKGATHTWKLQDHIVAKQGFSKYRIFQYGPNSNQHHYLALSGFEIYGTVIEGIEASAANFEVAQPSGPSRQFVHQYDMDYNGLFYFLGTMGFQRQWGNPMDLGLVTVTSSSVMSDSQPLSAVVGRSAVRCVTKPHNKSWIAVDLKDIKLMLTKYTIRHYSSWDTEALRYWNLEGSNDGRSWMPIRQHTDDRALRKAGGCHTWDVNCPQYFSQFRLFMTNRNSNNHWYLACSGIELYGTATGGLVSQRHQAQAPAQMQANVNVVNGNNQMNNNNDQMNNAPMAAFGAPQMQAMPAFGNQQAPMAAQGAMPAFGSPMMQGNAQGGAAVAAAVQGGGNGNKKASMTFDYESDFDGNGLCYWLGSKGGKQQWSNPCDSGALKVTSSGLMNDGQGAPISSVVGLHAVRCVTKPQKNAWFMIDFGNYAIMPTFYTLRHYSSWDTEALRYWRLEGSCDGEVWTVIREHNNDATLKQRGQMATWRLRCSQHFSKFRIFQFDKNSNGHYYLALSGFEIYGAVIRETKQYTWDQWPKNKSRHLQVDLNNNTVTNVDSGDTWQTVKVTQAFDFSRSFRQEFTILVEKVTKTTNAWKIMVGVAPAEFTCSGSRQWLGSQKSWGYIAGTGGKCYDVGKSLQYGAKYGEKAGDVVTCVVDANQKSIEYMLNGISQGVAFTNFDPSVGPMHPAASITATGSRIRLMERITPQSPFLSGQGGLPVAAQFGGGGQFNGMAQPAMGQFNRQFNAMSMQQSPSLASASSNLVNDDVNGQRSSAASVGQGMGSPRAIRTAPLKDLQHIAHAQVPRSNLASNPVKYGWDPILLSQNLFILPDGATVTNKGSGDRWEGIVSQAVFSAGKHSFEITVIADMKTSNTWKFVVGVVPVNFDPRKTGWIGSQGSWGYIGGTGGKCHDVPKSVAYAKKFGQNDVIKCEVDSSKGTIEFFKNGKSQGTAFKNLEGPVKPAVSLTGKGTCLRIGNVQ